MHSEHLAILEDSITKVRNWYEKILRKHTLCEISFEEIPENLLHTLSIDLRKHCLSAVKCINIPLDYFLTTLEKETLLKWSEIPYNTILILPKFKEVLNKKNNDIDRIMVHECFHIIQYEYEIRKRFPLSLEGAAYIAEALYTSQKNGHSFLNQNDFIEHFDKNFICGLEQLNKKSPLRYQLMLAREGFKRGIDIISTNKNCYKFQDGLRNDLEKLLDSNYLIKIENKLSYYTNVDLSIPDFK